MNIFENIFNNKEFKIKCIDKYDMRPYYTCIRELLEISSNYELLEVGKEYTVTNIRMCEGDVVLQLKEFGNKEFISDLFEDLFEDEVGKQYNVYKDGKLYDEKVEILYTLGNHTFVCYSTMYDEYFEYYLDDDEMIMKRD